MDSPFPSGSLLSALRYQPVELRFGTSGRRGEVADLSQLEIYINVLAELKYFLGLPSSEGGIARGEDFYFAYDLRPSSSALVPEQGGRGEIAQAVEQAIRDAGMNPVNLGRIPTPALTYYALLQGKGSIMITGSHIPFERNGYKFNSSRGELLKHHENPINRLVAAVRSGIYAQPLQASLFNEEGMFKDGSRKLSPENTAGRQAYLQRYAVFFRGSTLRGKKILVYQHSAVGRDLLLELLQQLGADAIPTGRSESFVPIDTENIDESVLARIQTLLDEAFIQHGPFEAVVSTDGDSDRPLILGLEPGGAGSGRPRVRFFGGDLVGMIVAEYLGSDAVVVPVTCNDGIDRGPLKSRLEPRTRIGSPYVIAGMEAARRKGKKAVCGWEANGGFLTGVDLEKEGRPLRALPTRDAFLPILAVLVAAGEKQVSLCTLFDRLPRRYSRAGLLKKFPRATSLKMLERLSPLEPSLIEAGFFPELSPCLDLNGLPLRVAAREVSRLCEIQQELEKVFSPSSGFAPINRINWTDGLRIHFANHDVAHVRPSGNADELRIYSVADSRDRAEAIVQAGVREPDGLLRRLESWIGTPSTMSSTPGASLLRLEGAVQNYEWGGFEFIPELLGIENLDRKPFGELWLGAHPKAPAQVIDGSERIPLNQLLERDPVRFLGETASARFNKKLPFLLKILDARQMLSIQAHPNKQQAVNGFARENVNQVPLDAPHRNYRDDNHKPEAHLALTEFWMLHGFRPAEEVAALWESTPEFHALAAGGHLLVPARSGNVETQANPVRELYAAIMRLPQVEVNGCLRPLCQRLDKECPSDKDHPDYWAWRAFREFPLPQGDLDRGIFSIYLLNLLHLHPGEGTYQPAGILHAYLEGTTVEIMANSDNVLRGGLTAKHVDISELLRIVTFAGKRPDLLKGEWTAATRRLFQTPAEEFELSVIEVTREQVHFSENRQGAEILISMEGAAILHSGSEVAALPRGAMVFLPSGVEYHLRALTERAVLYQAGIPAMRRN